MPSPAMKSSTKKMLAGALLLAATLVVTGRKAQETPLTQPAQKTSETTSIGKLKQHSSSSPAIQPTDNNLEMSPEPRRYSSLEDVKNARAFERRVEQKLRHQSIPLIDGCMGPVLGPRVPATMVVSLSKIESTDTETRFLIDRVSLNPVRGQMVAMNSATARCTEALHGVSISMPSDAVTHDRINNLPISIFAPAAHFPS